MKTGALVIPGREREKHHFIYIYLYTIASIIFMSVLVYTTPNIKLISLHHIYLYHRAHEVSCLYMFFFFFLWGGGMRAEYSFYTTSI